MMNSTTKKRFHLNIAIMLLISFNGMQLYGIFSQDRPASSSSVSIADDTVHVPLQINVLNGCGVSGVGSTMTAFCRKAGYDVVEMGNYRTFDVEHSIVIDRNGKMAEAIRLAGVLGIARSNVVQQFSNDQMVSASVVIGKDYQSLSPWK